MLFFVCIFTSIEQAQWIYCFYSYLKCHTIHSQHFDNLLRYIVLCLYFKPQSYLIGRFPFTNYSNKCNISFFELAEFL
jgi:hypothetical protein